MGIPAISTLTLEFGALFVLFALAAFFSMSETAMIGVNRHHVRKKAEEGSRRAKLLDSMLDDPERVLSTVLVGSTIVNISAAAVGTVIADDLFTSYASVIAAIATTLIVLIFCELTPKTLAVQNPLPIALNLARPLSFVEAILRPVIVLSTAIATGLVRPFGFKAKGNAPFITSDEIQMLVSMGVEEGHVEKFEQRVISELFDFTETDVHKVMTPTDKVHFLPKEATLNQAAELAGKTGRTRLLVVDGDFDHVLGCVHVRDLLRYTDADLARLPVTHALRAVLFAPADLPADRLLVRMQREHKLLAVISDGGHNVGICTVEDLLEELVGEIHDEFDAQRRDHKAESIEPAPTKS